MIENVSEQKSRSGARAALKPQPNPQAYHHWVTSRLQCGTINDTCTKILNENAAKIEYVFFTLHYTTCVEDCWVQCSIPSNCQRLIKKIVTK